MIDLGSMTDKFSETGQKVVRRAIDVSKSRDHNFLSLPHLLTALSEVESDLFAEAMQVVGIDPNSVKSLLEEELAKIPIHVGRKMALPEPTRNLFNQALGRARAQGRQQIESYDLFALLFTDQNGVPAEILRRLNVDPALATDAISQLICPREQQTLDALRRHIPQLYRILAREGQTTSFTFSKHTSIFKLFSELKPESLNSIVTIERKA